jgi:sugar phosphate isomerase/epimerase
MGAAFAALRPLADGVQLTPGNHPSPGFAERIAHEPTRTHHGFTPHARLQRVWNPDGSVAVDSDSVHAPALGECSDFWAHEWPVVEVMYPGHHLGSGAEIRAAMARGARLAIDVSHLHIQRTAGVLDDATLARVYDYDRIAEIHVSRSDGTRDLHAPLGADTFGLDWARARLTGGTPTVLECYMHRLSPDERRRQIALVRG